MNPRFIDSIYSLATPARYFKWVPCFCEEIRGAATSENLSRAKIQISLHICIDQSDKNLHRANFGFKGHILESQICSFFMRTMKISNCPHAKADLCGFFFFMHLRCYAFSHCCSNICQCFLFVFFFRKKQKLKHLKLVISINWINSEEIVHDG